MESQKPMPVSNHGRILLLVILVLESFALPTQFYLLLETSGFTTAQALVRFFSFFTILTNAIVAITSGVLLVGGNSKTHAFISRQGTLAAVTVYIFIVGLVYNIILRPLYVLVGLHDLVSEIFHTVVPILFVVYWVLYSPKQNLSVKSIPYWLIYPLLYMVYTLLNGQYSGFYPYPFVDVNVLGLTRALLNGGIVLIVFVVVSWIIVWIGRKTKA